MIKVPPLPFLRRQRRPATRPAAATPTPAALVLMAAGLEFEGSLALRLVFDRGVDAAGLDAAQISVEDPTGTGFRYVGEQLIDQPSPAELLIALAALEPATGSADVMTATAATGIVAVNDGGTWPGVSELPLPWP